MANGWSISIPAGTTVLLPTAAAPGIAVSTARVSGSAETIALAEGSVLRVATGGVRAIRAAPDQELRFLCVQARTGSMPDEEAKRDGIKVDGLTWA